MSSFVRETKTKDTMEKELIIAKLNRIEKHIVGLKEILNVEELCDYTGFKTSYVYKLVHKRSIPFSKPNGKMLFFERKKIDEWLLRNSYKSNDELQQAALNYVREKN